MIDELHPNTTYTIQYDDGTAVVFTTVAKIHQAKHLIRVILANDTNEEVDLLSLMSKKWVDIIEIEAQV